MKTNIKQLVEDINKLSTEDLKELSIKIEEIGVDGRRRGIGGGTGLGTGMGRNRKADRTSGRLYRKLYNHYSMPSVNQGEYENIPESEHDVQRYAMVVLGRATLTTGEINACKDIYAEFKK